MEWLILIGLFWITPIFICCHLAEQQGKSVGKTFVLTFVLGWLGGLLALVLLPKEEEPDSTISEAELERQRTEANLKALGRPSNPNKTLTDSRKRELEKYYGGAGKT